MQTTTITNDQIRSLRSEALSVGDYDMSIWCDLALASHEDCDSQGGYLVDPNTGKLTTRSKARAVCAKVVADAAAMND